MLKIEHHEPDEVYEYYRAADVCYVSSLHDGMNLVAKEFVAARDDERGVLILSQFTGAARELPEALIVNPYDTEQCAAALRVALDMPPDEQRERMRSMRSLIQEFNVYRWAGRMLLDAARMRNRRRVAGRATAPRWSICGAHDDAPHAAVRRGLGLFPRHRRHAARVRRAPAGSERWNPRLLELLEPAPRGGRRGGRAGERALGGGHRQPFRAAGVSRGGAAWH